MPDWLIQFLPAWEVAIQCVFAGAMLTAMWRAWCYPRKVRRRVVALVSMLITFLIALAVLWARGAGLIPALADAMLIGAISPGVWVAAMAAARKWAPWLATALGEDRRHRKRRETGWTPEQRTSALFDDTDPTLQREDVLRWREECARRGELDD